MPHNESGRRAGSPERPPSNFKLQGQPEDNTSLAGQSIVDVEFIDLTMSGRPHKQGYQQPLPYYGVDLRLTHFRCHGFEAIVMESLDEEREVANVSANS